MNIITDSEIKILKFYKDKPLLNGYNLCYIVNFEVEEKEIIKKNKRFFFPTQEELIKVKVLAKYDIVYFNRNEKIISRLSLVDSLRWIPIISYCKGYPPNFIKGIKECREDFLKMKESLEGFGHKVISDFERKVQENDEK